MAIIITAAAAAAVIAVYLGMVKASRLPESGRWLTEYKYAHRGLHGAGLPENSMGAFMAAVEKGYAVELDVHLSKDGEVVVHHDKTLERMTGKNGMIKDYSASELGAMALGGSAYTIPTLSDVLKAIDGKTPVLIETKNEGRAGELEKKLYDIMREYKGLYAVQSFSPFSVGWFRKNAPEVIRGQLSSVFRDGPDGVSWVEKSALKLLLTNFLCRPHFISYDKAGINRRLLKRLRAHGTPVLAWTVRSRAEEGEVLKYADTVIFENYIS